MSPMHNAPTRIMLVVEPDGVTRSTIAAVVRELDLAQVHQASSISMGTQMLMDLVVDALVLSLADNDAALDLLIRLRAGEFPSKAGIPVVVMAKACDGALALRLKELVVSRLLLSPFRIRDVVQTLEALVPDSSPAVEAVLALA